MMKGSICYTKKYKLILKGKLDTIHQRSEMIQRQLEAAVKLQGVQCMEAAEKELEYERRR